MSFRAIAVRASVLSVGAVVLATGVAAPAHASIPAFTKKDNRFWSAINTVEPSIATIGTKKDAVKLAKLTCKVFRNGASAEAVAMQFLDAGLTEDQAAIMIAGAIRFYCPDQESVLG